MEEYIKELMRQYEPTQYDFQTCKDVYDTPNMHIYNAGFRRGATQVLIQIQNKLREEKVND